MMQQKTRWKFFDGLFHVTTLMSLWTSGNAATTSVSCDPEGCLNQPFNLTCHITGSVTSGISWVSPEGKSVVTCDLRGDCEVSSGYQLLLATASQQTLQINRLSLKDAGTWMCRDGARLPIKSCEAKALEPPLIAELRVTCSRENEQFIVFCSGLRSHGIPVTSLTLNGSRFLNATTTGLSLKKSSPRFNGEKFTCAVSGPSSKCLDPSIITSTHVLCPGPSCKSVNTYLIVFELILILSGLANLLVLYLGASGIGQEEMLEKGTLWLVGIIIGTLLLLMGTVHAILLPQFCEVVGVLPLTGASMCGVSLLTGLCLVVISVLKKVALCRPRGYSVPENLKKGQGGVSSGIEEDRNNLEDDM